MARLKTKQISDFTSAVQSLIDNDTDQNAALIDAVEASVDSLEIAEDAAIASIDSLETLAGAAAVATEVNASIDSLETAEDAAIASIDSLETALGDEITATGNEVNAINASIDSLELYDLVFEQGATVAGPTQFTLNTPVKFGSNDDLLVFINGHNIHKDSSSEGGTDGYTTADGATFNLVSIGYDIDVTDHVTVIGIRG